MIEFEVKAILSVSEYLFLKTKRFHMGNVVLQRNYYYDTADFELNRNKITCRIREKNGNYTATIKDHQSHGCNIETSRPAESSTDASFFDGMGISCQGELVTLRTTCTTYDGFSVALDENQYLGKIDYEIEYEFDPDRQAELAKEIFELSQDLEYHKIIKSAEEFRHRFINETSKSQRFFQRKKELQSLSNKTASLLRDT